MVTNSLCFRSDYEFGKGRSAHGRILMFGDSYTAGDDVSNADRYSDQLARILGIEVQNYGVPGTGTDQHLLWWAIRWVSSPREPRIITSVSESAWSVLR